MGEQKVLRDQIKAFFSVAWFPSMIWTTPRALRTHILRLLGPKTILYKAFGLF